MSNICMSYRSVPALSFSISRGGDWIDENVSSALDMPVSRVAAAKERGFDLGNPQGRVEEALTIYYHDLIRYTIDQIGRQISNKKNMPTFNQPVEIVVCGGTSMVDGFVDAFKKELHTTSWPIDIANVRLASDPLRTVSKGCLIAAREFLSE